MRGAAVVVLVLAAGVAQAQGAGLVDPFRSILDVEPDWVPERMAGVVLGEFELDQLRWVAVVSGVASPVAMVEDPTGQGHVVRVGMLLGKDGALVRSISRQGIVLEQTIRKSDQTRVRTQVNVKLPR